MKPRHSREQWEAWLLEFRSSDLTITEFCARKKIQPQTFYRWRKKLTSKEVSDSDSRDKSFLAVKLVPAPSIEIDLPCGAMVRVPSDKRCLDQVFLSLLEIEGDS